MTTPVLARPPPTTDPPIPELEYAVDVSTIEGDIVALARNNLRAEEGAAMQAGIDLRTLEGALDFLDYHAPTDETLPKHQAVNAAFKELTAKLWNNIPDGPGKTVAIRAIGRARMECNSAIATGGA